MKFALVLMLLAAEPTVTENQPDPKMRIITVDNGGEIYAWVEYGDQNKLCFAPNCKVFVLCLEEHWRTSKGQGGARIVCGREKSVYWGSGLTPAVVSPGAP